MNKTLYSFETVAKLTKRRPSSNYFMSFFTYKIGNIREKIITMQHQLQYCNRQYIVVSLRNCLIDSVL